MKCLKITLKNVFPTYKRCFYSLQTHTENPARACWGGPKAAPRLCRCVPAPRNPLTQKYAPDSRCLCPACLCASSFIRRKEKVVASSDSSSGTRTVLRSGLNTRLVKSSLLHPLQAAAGSRQIPWFQSVPSRLSRFPAVDSILGQDSCVALFSIPSKFIFPLSLSELYSFG